jgi:hypothetical protein
MNSIKTYKETDMRRFTVFAAFILIGGVVVPVARNAQAADIPPVRVLDQRLAGKAALAELKVKNLLPAVASAVGKSEAEIVKILESDQSAVIDEEGSLFYVEPVFDPAIAARIDAEPKVELSPDLAGAKPAPDLGPIPDVSAIAPPTAPPGSDGSGPQKNAPDSPVVVTPAPDVAQGPFPYSQTFLLNSRPGSSKTIFLKFNGYSTNAASSAWPTYTGPAWDIDANPGTFNAAEQDIIQSIWQRVAEDYAVFDVNVTTQDPGFAAIDRVNLADTVFGTTAAFVNGPSTVPCGGPAGGCAYLSKFDTIVPNHQEWQPAWVFGGNLANNAKYMAEAATHEVGHNFGMSHDGCNAVVGSCTVAQFGYYEGHGNWAPIMGVGYYRPVSQWSKGEYLGANQTQDDIAIIASQTGYVPDTPNVSVATATDIGVIWTPQTGSGLISSSSDYDYFRFYSPFAGTIQITGLPAPTSPNLDFEVVLYNAAGGFVTSADPTSGTVNFDVASGMGATITLNLPTWGYYYIGIDNRQTDGLGDTGYTYYGSLGAYSLKVETLTTSGDAFWPVTPTRLLDTRPNPVPTGTSIDLLVAGVGGVPANATAVALNIAAVGPPAAAGHLRVYPTGTPLPTASVLNFATGKNTPNHVIVKVGAGGKISIYDGGTASVIVDVNGYFRANSPVEDGYVPVATPTRIANIGLAGGATTNVTVLGAGGIAPGGGIGAGVIAVVVNVGAINPTQAGHLRVFPAGSPLPPASTNNFVAGDSRMNLVIVQPGVGGQISIFNAASGSVSLTVDTVGYFQWGGQGFKPIDPVRPIDTRAPLDLVAAGDWREVQIRGFSGIPNTADVKSVVINVASVNPTASGSIDVGPSGANPALPSFTHPANENVANLVLVPVGADGKIRIRNNSGGTSHIIADITGYFTD